MEDSSNDLPSTRKLAQQYKTKFFFTGKYCQQGHLAPRYTSTGQCVDCVANYHQKNSTPRKRAIAEEIPVLANNIVNTYSGHIVSGIPDSAKAKILVECNFGHVFETNYDRLKQGKWCRQCFNAKSGQQQLGYTVEDMQLIAENRGGKFLSSTFVGVKQKHEFWCSKHGAFWATPDNLIHTQQWCPKCWDERRNKDKLLPFDDVEKYIFSRGGLLVSSPTDYKTRKSYIRVHCQNGHEWRVSAAQLMAANSWCPQCNDSIGETITRHVFEATYGMPFPKCRPDWLKTEKGGCLELDGYNQDLSLAFEYQGPYHQHSGQIKRDNLKRERCKERGVKLIEVPYTTNPYPPENIRLIVEKILMEIGVSLPILLPDGELFPSKLKDLQELAKSKGGSLISEQYLGETSQHLWKCSNPAHPAWNAEPYRIRQGTWCAHCAGVARKDMHYLELFAAKHDLAIREQQYKGAGVKYAWNCTCGHIFSSTKDNILQRVRKGLNACPMCAGTYRKITITDLQSTALQRNGECLTNEYKNAHTLIDWSCSNGHRFSRNWNKVQQGYWCTVTCCSDNRKWG